MQVQPRPDIVSRSARLRRDNRLSGAAARRNRSTSALNRLLLPALGGPVMATRGTSVLTSRAESWASVAATISCASIQPAAKRVAADELDVLVDKVEPRL